MGKLWARFLLWLDWQIHSAVESAKDEYRDEDEAYHQSLAEDEAYKRCRAEEEACKRRVEKHRGVGG